MRRGWLFLWLCFLPVGGWSAGAESKGVPPLVERVQLFLNKVKTLEAEFYQRIENPEAGVPGESQGQISTSKPGRFRWDYQQPYEQTIVSDGQSIWLYEPDLAQVTVTKASRLDQTPALLLANSVSLVQSFTWEVSEEPHLHLPALRLFPRQGGSVKEITLVLHPERDELLKLTTQDSLGHVSHFTFRGMRINQSVPAERFRLAIPPGVDIIEDRAQSSDPS
ncbi:outer membrane lipoprotein chaperone LolA [Candidatus Magnetaquicoccus inordinatus]|uniref:outer membrane lipoprotein chaperone LolA n=1 Tax=Candidatus Magnetaquicoccus inordinatus TaxID=2496818 RepID=UPI00187D4A79|nr:outer membrane lipoprotein chaperone LolA [Candidatus Magnetaquicoccus inordinatus]